MSISSSLNLSIVLGDGTASMTKTITGLTYNGTNESYTNTLTVGTGSQDVTLPQTPVGTLHVRNLAPAGVPDPVAPPALSQSAGGSLPARTYYAKVTLVNASGESAASPEASLAVSANNLLTVSSPTAVSGSNPTGYNIYVGSSSGAETKQNSSPIAIGTNWTQSALTDPTTAPTLTQSSGGSLAAATYYVKITLVNAAGETNPSPEASLAVSADNVLGVASPASVSGATGYNVYAGTSSGTETKQNSAAIAFGTNWTEPTSGLIAGSALPTSNTTGLLSGSALPLSNTTANILTVTWTKQGGTSAGIIDLPPQAAIDFCMPNPTGTFIPSGKGGITALSLQASGAGCSCEVVVNG